MFRTLRAQHNLTQQEVADQTNLSPNYVLKAEQLTFPIPSPVLADFYLKLDPSLDLDYLKSWYAQEQKAQREMWLSSWQPALDPGSFRKSWQDIYAVPTVIPPTQYALSNGLCIPASVVYAMERGARPHLVKQVLNQLIDFVESGRFEAEIYYGALDSAKALSGLKVLKEHFV